MLGESRRIQYYQIIDRIHIVQILECIHYKRLVACISGEIVIHSTTRKLYRTCGTVNGMHQLCPAAQCGKRESSRIAEQVEHPPSSGVCPDQGPVLPLVEEESCFLPRFPIDKELVPVFGYHPPRFLLPAQVEKVSVAKVKPCLERGCPGTFVVNGFEP